MEFKNYEITDLAKKNIEKSLKSWNVKENVKLFALPMGIIAQYVNCEDEIEYCAFTEFGQTISHYVHSDFKKATLEVMFRAEITLINAAERVLKTTDKN